MENRRHRATRVLFSCPEFERRQPTENGGYPAENICPTCGCAIVTDGKTCRECEQQKDLRENVLFF